MFAVIVFSKENQIILYNWQNRPSICIIFKSVDAYVYTYTPLKVLNYKILLFLRNRLK